MLNAMTDLERLLDAAGMARFRYISFDNPPVRISQELSVAEEQKVPEETLEQSIKTSKTSCDREVFMLNSEMTVDYISTKNVHNNEHCNNNEQTGISFLQTEGISAIFTSPEPQRGVSAPAGLIDPSRHVSSALAGSAVPPRTTLDRLRAGEMRP